jgi:hypothetical protein
MTRLQLVLALLAVAALAAPLVRAEEVSSPPAPAQDAAAVPPKPRLAAWRAGARPPSDVPPTAIVKAARKDEKPGAGPVRKAGAAADPEPSVEIIWHAPGS